MPSAPTLSNSEIARLKAQVRLTGAQKLKTKPGSTINIQVKDPIPHYQADIHHIKAPGRTTDDIMVAKKQRLKRLLMHKFVAQHGPSFIGTHDGKITTDDLNELDTIVLKAMKNQVRRSSSTFTQNIPSLQSNQTVKKESESITDHSFQNESLNISKPAIEDKGDEPIVPFAVEGFEWDYIAAYDKLQSDERVRKEEEESKIKKSILKQTLEKQIEEAKALKLREKEAKLREAEKYRLNKEKLEQEKFAKTIAITQRVEQERALRIQQINEERARREAELLTIKESEKAEILRINELRRQECEAAILKRQEDIRRRQQLVQANEELRLMKSLQRKQETEEDQRMVREYSNRVEKEFMERTERNRQRHAALDNIALNYEKHGSIQEKLQERKRMDEQLLRAAALKAEERQREEERRQEERRRRELLALEENEKLRQSRELARSASRDEDRQYVALVRNESEIYLKQAAEKKAEEQERQRQYRESLLAQIRLKKAGVSTAAHADIPTFDEKERALNLCIIKKITSDKDLFIKVHEGCQRRRPMSAGATRRNPITGHTIFTETTTLFGGRTPLATSPLTKNRRSVAWL